MKKSLLIFASLYGSVASAQITITQSDFITVGKTIYQAIDSNATIMIGSAGANRTWNFSSLASDSKDTIDVVTPGSTPYASNFPGANLAGSSHGDQGDLYFYLNLSASAFQLDGAAAPGLLIDFNPNETVTTLPATYGTNFTNNFGMKTDILYTSFPGYDSLRIKSTTSKTSSYDAYGSLTLAMGTYNTIRLAETRITTDSLFLHATGPFPPAGWFFAQESKDTTYRYAWYANNVGYTLVQIDSNRTDGKTVSFLLAEPLSIVAASEVKTAEVYPNPASEFMNVKYEGASNDMLNIYDLSGSLVRREVLANGANRISLQDIAAGMYIYNVTTQQGEITHTGKFSVTK